MFMRFRFFSTIILTFLAVCAFAQPVVITPPSAVIQPGDSVTLTASGALYYQWSPAAGLSVTDDSVTVASPSVTTTYTCSGYAPGDESVFNGNFDQGNVGFTSAYSYSSDLYPESTYNVGPNAANFHPDFLGTGHGGTGNFMVVNGATTPNTNVWTEQITVVPNTYYAFSTWVCTVSAAGDEARLQFSINGHQIGDVFSAPSYTGEWLQFYELWYSGNSTSATITILNQNTMGSGNDFGLDDISFCELVLVGAPQCTVAVEAMTAAVDADNTELCEGASTTLHAMAMGGIGNYTYSWSPANTLNDPTAQDPVATPPVGSTTYTCHFDDGYSTLDVSITIVVHPNETENVYETICENDTFDFYGEMVSEPGVYEHHLQTQYGCDKTIYLHLDNWSAANETVLNEYICAGESYEFYGVSYNHTCQEVYVDHTSHWCDSIVRLNLTVYPANDTTLIDPSICEGETYNFHGVSYSQDGQIAYFDTVDLHGCLKVEKLVLSVGEFQMPPVLNQYECYEHGTVPSWTWDKTGVTYHEDTTDEIVLDDPNGGCPIKHRLNLKFHEEYYHEETKVACDAYYWPITGETYYESQDPIVKTFHNVFGDQECDSTFVLHLEINTYETTEFTVPYDESCDSYFWDNRGLEYTTDDAYDPEDHVYTKSGSYRRTYVNEMGCDSVVTMNVHLDYTPSPTPICPMDWDNPAPHWVITASEFEINAYDFFISDTNPECIWDTVTWSFEDESLQWVLEPAGDKGSCCKVFVLNIVDDTVWLKARVFNRCAPEEGVSQRYWLVCSYYGVEEQNGNRADFSVMPNPNNGQMTLCFEHFTGKINVKVYDMKGALLDSFQTYNDLTTNSIQYSLNKNAGGLYFFVVTGKEGSVTRKVIIEQ